MYKAWKYGKIYHLIILHLQIWVIEHEFLKVVATGVQQTSNSEGTVGTKNIINLYINFFWNSKKWKKVSKVSVAKQELKSPDTSSDMYFLFLDSHLVEIKIALTLPCVLVFNKLEANGPNRSTKN